MVKKKPKYDVGPVIDETISDEPVFLVCVADNNDSDESIQEHLLELDLLVNTAGGINVGNALQRRKHKDPAHYIGSGKVEEISTAVELTGADTVIFDVDLSPVQTRNLEKALKRKVLDRTDLILDIFALHARTHEGKLQVELAQLNYMMPRLIGAGLALSRLGGGIGTRGPGETKLEFDRRKISKRIRKLESEIEELRKHRKTLRGSRRGLPVVSMVGYTNAGKSSLMNALTGSDIYVADQLFATLDTTTRRIDLGNERMVLLTDTVGFIRHLPGHLLAAFRATLEEISSADLILHVVDCTNSNFPEHIRTVDQVLEDLNVSDIPSLVVWNKVDNLPADISIERMEKMFSPSIGVSALTGENIDRLNKKIVEVLDSQLLVADFLIPYERSVLVHRLHTEATVLDEEYVNDGISVKARIKPSNIGPYMKYQNNSASETHSKDNIEDEDI